MPFKGPTLGWEALEWITANLVIPDGERRGEPLVLTDEQAELILRFYALDPKGDRLYRRALISRPKGWGKSPLLAALCAFEACGPCRFSGWKNGEAAGKPVPTPLVQLAAVSEDQTENTYSLLYQMLSEGPALDHYGLDVGLTRVFIPGGGKIEPVTSQAGTREGQRVTFACLDETHLWLPGNKGVQLAATIRRNAAKMNGATFETTNAYRPGQESVAEKSAEAAKVESKGLLYDHREPSRSPSLDNKQELRKALIQVYGDARAWVDVDRLMAEVADPATDPSDARRFYLNQIVHAADAAFDIEQWNALADASALVPDGELVVLGFDGARFHDTTALVATTVETGHQFVLGIWERPQEAGEDWEVDESDVDAVVEQAFERYDIWRLYGDPPYWESALDRWAGRWPDQIVRWWTNRNKPMAYALRAYATAQRGADLSHDGDTVMARHVGNARKRETRLKDEEGRWMWLISKEHPNSANKIDAAMAGCLSWEARGDAIAAGATKTKNKSRVPVSF